jgi:hypothetical protein
MALKWAGILVATVAITLTVTANVFAPDGRIPSVVNMVAIASAAVATVIAIIGDLYARLDTKLNQLEELVTSRFDHLDAETGDRNAGFVEGYLLGHGPNAAVVPMTPRGRRAAAPADD